MTFLILDDLESNRLLLRCMLSNIYKHAIILESSTGEECVTMYDELLSSFYVIDAIFLDYNLPDMTGADVAKKLRKLQYEGPLLMLSASSDEKIKEYKNTNLFCKVIQKPLSHAKLKELLQCQLTCHIENAKKCNKIEIALK